MQSSFLNLSFGVFAHTLGNTLLPTDSMVGDLIAQVATTQAATALRH